MKLKTKTLNLLASVAALSSPSLANPPEAHVVEKPKKTLELDAGQRAVMKASFESADKAKNGVLRAEEFEKACGDFQKRMLAALNVKSKTPPKVNPLPGAKHKELFSMADINKDNAVSLDEFQRVYPALKVAVFRANPGEAPWILTDPCPFCGRG